MDRIPATIAYTAFRFSDPKEKGPQTTLQKAIQELYTGDAIDALKPVSCVGFSIDEYIIDFEGKMARTFRPKKSC